MSQKGSGSMSIGSNIRKKRENLKISQTKLAESVGISQSLMAQFERGSKIPNMMLGREIASVLQCKMEDLVSDEEAVNV